MKYVVYTLLSLMFLSGCSQSKSKIATLAERYCRCVGSEAFVVRRISYFGSLKATVECEYDYRVDIGQDDFIRDCKRESK